MTAKKNVKKGTGFTRQNDPLLTRRDNGFYDEGGHYLIFKCKLKRWIVKIKEGTSQQTIEGRLSDLGWGGNSPISNGAVV